MAQNISNKPIMTEQQKETLRKTKERHEKRLQTDPEYRKLWEERERDLRRFIFPGDNKED